MPSPTAVLQTLNGNLFVGPSGAGIQGRYDYRRGISIANPTTPQSAPPQQSYVSSGQPLALVVCASTPPVARNFTFYDPSLNQSFNPNDPRNIRAIARQAASDDPTQRKQGRRALRYAIDYHPVETAQALNEIESTLPASEAGVVRQAVSETLQKMGARESTVSSPSPVVSRGSVCLSGNSGGTPLQSGGAPLVTVSSTGSSTGSSMPEPVVIPASRSEALVLFAREIHDPTLRCQAVAASIGTIYPVVVDTSSRPLQGSPNDNSVGDNTVNAPQQLSPAVPLPSPISPSPVRLVLPPHRVSELAEVVLANPVSPANGYRFETVLASIPGGQQFLQSLRDTAAPDSVTRPAGNDVRDGVMAAVRDFLLRSREILPANDVEPPTQPAESLVLKARFRPDPERRRLAVSVSLRSSMSSRSPEGEVPSISSPFAKTGPETRHRVALLFTPPRDTTGDLPPADPSMIFYVPFPPEVLTRRDGTGSRLASLLGGGRAEEVPPPVGETGDAGEGSQGGSGHSGGGHGGRRDRGNGEQQEEQPESAVA